jgi:hypothetical protein
MEIKRSGSQPSGKGPADYFTGTVRIDPLFEAPGPARVRAASVTFEPGARTAWHMHPLSQTLVVRERARSADHTPRCYCSSPGTPPVASALGITANEADGRGFRRPLTEIDPTETLAAAEVFRKSLDLDRREL